MFEIVRTEEEFNRVWNWADDGHNMGTRYPGMSYEQGIIDVMNWLCGDDNHAPDED
jgi:hypothetical protein